MPVAWLSTVRPPPPAPRCSRCQGKLCKLRCKVGNTFWPRPKPDCAASELIAHIQTDGQTDRQRDKHAHILLLSLVPSLSLSCSAAAACIHFHLQHLLVDTLRPSASSRRCRSRRCTPQTHLAKLHCLAMSSHRSRRCLAIVVVAIVKR